MYRSLSAVAALTLGMLWLLPAGGAAQGKQEWGTIKGRIVWGGKNLPIPRKIVVPAMHAACVGKGDLFDDSLIVSAKDRGVKDVLLWLVDADGKPLPVHPDLKQHKNTTVTIDQPRCLFVPRIVVTRQGDTLLAKNSAKVDHNFSWNGEENGAGNKLMPPGSTLTLKNLKAEPMPMLVKCDLHMWMRARVAVFDHPYYALTGEDGRFEIKLAPAGGYRLKILHDAQGWRLGAKGRGGEPVQIKAGGVTDLGELKIGK